MSFSFSRRMTHYSLAHTFGTLYCDGKGNIVRNPPKTESAPEYLFPVLLAQYKKPQFFPRFRSLHLQRTVRAIQQAFARDELLIEAIETVGDLETLSNQVALRLRHWAEPFYPEATRHVQSNLELAQCIATKKQQDINQEYSQSMGVLLQSEDQHALQSFANQLLLLETQKEYQQEYLKKIAFAVCPNTAQMVGPHLAAKLIAAAGSLKKFAFLPASTVQLLGAEAALFKHLLKKTACPKYGYLYLHPFVTNCARKERGKRARALADALSIAARVDYFKGRPIAQQLLTRLNKRFSCEPKANSRILSGKAK